MLRNQLSREMGKLIGKRQLIVEASKFINFGDYSTNIALKAKNKNSREYAEEVVEKLNKSKNLKDIVEKIEVAGQGFINIWLNKSVLFDNLFEIIENKDYGKTNLFKGKRILIEHTSPNPQTTIMLGHLRNNFLGMSIANIFEFLGAGVIRDCIINDRGIHISRSIWGYLAFAYKDSGFNKEEILRYKELNDEKLIIYIEKINWRDLINKWTERPDDWYDPSELNLKSDHANLIWYVLGSRSFKISAYVNKQVKEILQSWEKEEDSIWKIWRKILEWSEKGYEET